jgi:RNA polymerase sigma factor (sigma-70 family)
MKIRVEQQWSRNYTSDISEDTIASRFERQVAAVPDKLAIVTDEISLTYRALDRKAHLSRRGFYVGTDIDPLHDTLLGHSDLEQEVGSGMNRVLLERAFEDLPEIQRRTLNLFYFQGLELSEISERLNEPLGNVRHHFYRGLEKLRKRDPQATLQIAGKPRRLFTDDQQALAWLQNSFEKKQSTSAEELQNWALVRGNAARNANSAGGMPLMNPRWRVSTTNHPELESALVYKRKEYIDSGLPFMPVMQPLAVGDVVLMLISLTVEMEIGDAAI